MLSIKDTIAAISTPSGPGGIGVIRISGPEAIGIGATIFRPARPELVCERRMSFGRIVGDSGDTIDQVMAFYITAPRTYTGQDVFEIQAHGGTLVLQEIMDLIIRKGARTAQHGEFTYRAFMEGKVDLTKAEALVELINAKSKTGSRLATRQMMGTLRRRIEGISQAALETAAELEAEVDFPEDENSHETIGQLEKSFRTNVIGPIGRLIKEAEAARTIRETTRVALAGPVNAGKSSLMNALCRHERAIISDIPGTTRDYLEAELDIEGLPITLVDTAGFRKGRGGIEEPVESLGLEITERVIEDSQFILLVLDSAKTTNYQPFIDRHGLPAKKLIVVLNKTDRPDSFGPKDLSGPVPIICTSAKERSGLRDLRAAIRTKILGGGSEPEALNILPNQRQAECLGKAEIAFIEAEKGLENRLLPEILLGEIREGLEQLGQITGESVDESILDRIFERFCIGK